MHNSARTIHKQVLMMRGDKMAMPAAGIAIALSGNFWSDRLQKLNNALLKTRVGAAQPRHRFTGICRSKH
ncbi:hypothetical protein WKK05_29360 [Nostoc sp. UHCC 0302]|uniref:hypothetical protein n=1 Tax=Nostoc sp. UHCC 0302 TaxID=3134896 RepID=UPI00311CA7D9